MKPGLERCGALAPKCLCLSCQHKNEKPWGLRCCWMAIPGKEHKSQLCEVVICPKYINENLKGAGHIEEGQTELPEGG